LISLRIRRMAGLDVLSCALFISPRNAATGLPRTWQQ
jgi:hypothetical protein